MKPRFVQVMTGLMIAVAALSACRKEVPVPVPKPDEVPRPTTQVAWAGR